MIISTILGPAIRAASIAVFVLCVALQLGSCDTGTDVPEDYEGVTLGFAEEDYANDARQTADGGYIITGSTNSIRGNEDVYVVKTNRNYTVEWSKSFGNNGPDRGNRVIQTLDGGFAVVGTVVVNSGNQDMFVAKLDPKGKTLWTRHFGGNASDEGRSITELPDGSLVVVGWTSSFGAGNSDVYLVKLDAFGRLRWLQTYGGTDADRGYDVAIAGDGGFIVTGSTANFGATVSDAFLLKVAADGQQQWFIIYDDLDVRARNEGRSVTTTPDGGFALAGTTHSGPPFPIYNTFLVKTDGNGNIEWSSAFAFSNSDDAYAMHVSRDGHLLVAGRSYLNHLSVDYQIILFKVSMDGFLQWVKTFGGTGNEIAYGLSPTSSGYLLTGFTQSYGAGKSDMYLLEVDESGETR